uniref:HIG1 domain-containing protein n=3 Tax=Setaria TaxID=4554 RepID=K4A2Y8_SETIT
IPHGTGPVGKFGTTSTRTAFPRCLQRLSTLGSQSNGPDTFSSTTQERWRQPPDPNEAQRRRCFRRLFFSSTTGPATLMEKSSGAAAGGTAPPSPFQMEDFQLEGKKPVKNPFVPIGALVTAGVLTAGLISFRYGNSQLGQKLMRARVVAQGATVALMIGSAYYYGDQIKLFKKGSSP